MEKIYEYFKAALAAILAIFGVEMKEIDPEVKDNLESMYDNITGYEPEV